MTTLACPGYAGCRFPAEVISYAVWLCFRFPLSLRMVDGLLAARGSVVSHETVRRWALRFGQEFANQVRRRLPAAGDEQRVALAVEQRKRKGLSKRAENAHQPSRRRERQRKRFKSAGQAHRFLSAHDGISNLFLLRRHRVPAAQYRAARFGPWVAKVQRVRLGPTDSRKPPFCRGLREDCRALGRASAQGASTRAGNYAQQTPAPGGIPLAKSV